ncbi:cytochrome P450 [Mycena olivaceomarginata]|nr:cytochrome P450 [Mycena olivaceomarginata]
MGNLIPFLAGCVAVLIAYVTKKFLFPSKLEVVPAIGSPGALTSYLDAFRFLLRSEELIQQGYNRYNGTVFRIPSIGKWKFVASGPTLLKDMCYSPEDSLSFEEAIRDQLQADLTFGPRDVPNHLVATLTKLTRNLGRQFPDVRDELVCAFDDTLELEGTDWKPITVLPAITDIVARISGRLFVGLPLCRNPEYQKFSIKHTFDVALSGRLIGYLPKFLRPILGPLISSRKRNMRQAMRLLGPLVAERIALFETHGGDWPDKPNDLVSWLLDMAQPYQRTVPGVVQRILVVIMGAIHTSSFTFAEALLDLATYTSYIEPLREEVERVINKQGWTKAALGDMTKIDSFLRESQRINGFGSLSMARKVIHPDGFTFSDGTFLPTGSFVQVPVRPIHLDPDNFVDPHVFDGFRFYNMRSESAPEGDKARFKQYMVTTEPTHLPFGHGKHAYPGRFFAATELKAMLAHIVLNYDIKLETEGVRPPDKLFDALRIPDPKAQVWFRKREV